jgi:hypothetical protein
MSGAKTALLLVGVYFTSFALAVTTGLRIVSAGSGPAMKQPAPFSDFLEFVDQGSVKSLHVKGRVCVFRMGSDGRNVDAWTIGPFEDEAAVRSLRPARLDLPAPEVVFER